MHHLTVRPRLSDPNSDSRREFGVTLARLGWLPHLETFTWQNLTLTKRSTRSSRPGYPPRRVVPPVMWTSRDQIKRGDYIDRPILQLSGHPFSCKQVLNLFLFCRSHRGFVRSVSGPWGEFGGASVKFETCVSREKRKCSRVSRACAPKPASAPQITPVESLHPTWVLEVVSCANAQYPRMPQLSCQYCMKMNEVLGTEVPFLCRFWCPLTSRQEL